MSLMSEFREFVLKGNAIDLAIGIVLGAAFGNVVSSVTEGFIRPLLMLLAPNPAVGLVVGPFNVGIIIVALINFLLTAAVLFFFVVKPLNSLRRIAERRRQTE